MQSIEPCFQVEQTYSEFQHQIYLSFLSSYFIIIYSSKAILHQSNYFKEDLILLWRTVCYIGNINYGNYTILVNQQEMQGPNFNFPACKFHPENLVSHICFEGKVSLVCNNCLTSNQCCADHLRFVRSVDDFISNIEENVKELRSFENLANSRFDELTELAGKAKMGYAK